jgi:hypothetical protein
MKKSIFNVFLSIVLWLILCAFPYFIRADEEKITHEQENSSMTLTDYYQQDLIAQCNGLKFFNEMKKENDTLLIYDKFNKEYQLTIDYIKRDSEYLGLDNYKCPE